MSEVTKSGATFVVLFVMGFVVGLGSLAGSFADADQVFVDRYASQAAQVWDAVGGLLLFLSSLALAWFVQALSALAQRNSRGMQICGSAAALGIFLAAVVWLAVPASMLFGSIYGDPGIGQGIAVLPQMGYVALMVGGLLPAGLLIAFVGHQDLLPRWLARASYPIAFLVAFSSLLFTPILLFVAWIIAVAVVLREAEPTVRGL